MCDECAILRGQEILHLQDENDPLIWMNQVYQASIHDDPRPYDSAVQECLDLAVATANRPKTVHRHIGQKLFDDRTHNKAKLVACQTPQDIFDQDSPPRVGEGTHGRKAARGRFVLEAFAGVMRRMVSET
jgi:hypothetical protein